MDEKGQLACRTNLFEVASEIKAEEKRGCFEGHQAIAHKKATLRLRSVCDSCLALYNIGMTPLE